MEIEALDKVGRLAFLTDGSVVPITTLIDGDGEETDDIADAVAFVCGSGDLWLANSFSNFEAAKTQ